MQLILGDCLDKLKLLPENSADALVTDPPAGISFMGKEWDTDKGGRDHWIAWMRDVMRECHRVLKPGAHGLVWALPRTSHWTATALEDAGFEVRDVVTHLFGSGFPKSLDVSKAIDKAAGAEREVVSTIKKTPSAAKCHEGWERPWAEGKTTMDITAPATDAAKQWQGWGTALKPASEHWILVRKPCSEKTVAANVLKWGTGALNIDASRVEGQADRPGTTPPTQSNRNAYGTRIRSEFTPSAQGRFPANLVFSHTPYCTEEQCDIECAVRALDGQSGPCKTGNLEPHHKLKASNNRSMWGPNQERSPRQSFGGDAATGASRFFYCAKISKSERNAGLDEMEDRVLAKSGGAAAARGESYFEGSGFNKTMVVKNHHPTVKPKKLMSYLIRMITPPGGMVLDPFMGSGSTGVAAVSEGFRFLGIEREPDYKAIAEKRIFNAFPEAQKQYKLD